MLRCTSFPWYAGLLICGLLSTAFNNRAPADDTPVFTSEESAGPDYAVQGEYVGLVDGDNWGAQVIALGDGKFQCTGYPGGLPGDGFDSSREKRVSQGQTHGDVTEFQGENYRLEIKQGRLKVLSGGDRMLGELIQVRRQSPTLGSKPPAGAVVLFDGSSAEQFTSGKMTAEKWLESECKSRQSFGDHQLHIEFRTPFKPAARGQARGNSGVYLQSRYELQILDSFGLSGENNECGGFYSIAKPSVNMCYPPLVWQTYDIDFQAARYTVDGKKSQNARVTVRHNGVLIHKDLELPKHTPGQSEEGPAPLPLYLQGHGNPVVYRNIWVVAKPTDQ